MTAVVIPASTSAVTVIFAALVWSAHSDCGSATSPTSPRRCGSRTGRATRVEHRTRRGPGWPTRSRSRGGRTRPRRERSERRRRHRATDTVPQHRTPPPRRRPVGGARRDRCCTSRVRTRSQLASVQAKSERFEHLRYSCLATPSTCVGRVVRADRRLRRRSAR